MKGRFIRRTLVQAMAVPLLLLAGQAFAAAQTAAAPQQVPAATAAAAPSARVMRESVVQPVCTGAVGAPEVLQLSAGKSAFMNLGSRVSRLTVGDEQIVHARLVSPTSLYLLGGNVGTTNMILQGPGGNCSILDVIVQIDPADFRKTLETVMPHEKDVQVRTAGDSIVLAGTVSDAPTAERIESMARSYVIRTARNLDAIASQAASGGTSVSMNSGSNATKTDDLVINMLSVASPQQVMLEVKIAEVSKTLLDKIGASFSAGRSNGWGSVSLLSDFLTGTAGGMLGILKPDSYRIMLEAEKDDGLVRILAEPNVMAISGQEGSFLAGGKILIPVAQNNTGLGGSTITLEEKEFGVGLKFTPTVLGDGRINLKVAPEVSELSRDGVGVTSGGFFAGTTVLPLITTRRASTTVQLFDGQSFAIGGLIKNSAAANVKAFPFLGEVPVLGLLFRSSDFQSEKTELVFVVTPRLVKPLPPDYQLPTDVVGEPNRNRVMLEGRLDTDPPAPARGSRDARNQPPAAGGFAIE